MSAWQGLMDLEIPVTLSRYEWALARARFYFHTGVGELATDGTPAPMPFARPEPSAWPPGTSNLRTVPGKPYLDRFQAPGDWLLHPWAWEERATLEEVLALHDWWRDTPFAEERVTFRVPLVKGAWHTWNPPVEHKVDALAGELVAIRWPHPWLPESAIPETAFRKEPLYIQTTYDGENVDVHTYRLVDPAFAGHTVLFNHVAHRHGLVRLEHPVPGAGGVPVSYLMGRYVNHADGNWLKTEEARYVALAGIIVTGGVLLGAAGGLGALAGGGTVGATGGGLGLGLGGWAAIGLTVGGAGAVGTVEAATGADLGGLQTLRELAKGTAYISAAFDTIWLEFFRQMVVVAQDPERADRLRYRLAALAAELRAGGGLPLAVTRLATQALLAYAQGAYVDSLALNAGQEAALEVAEQAIRRVRDEVAKLNDRELERIVDERLRAYQLQELQAAIDSLTVAEAAAPPIAPPDPPAPAPEVPEPIVASVASFDWSVIYDYRVAAAALLVVILLAKGLHRV